MKTQKRKKLPTKEIKRIIEKNYQNAAFLFNDRDNVKKLLAELEEYIANNTTIIDSFEDIRKLILIIRDVSDDKCNTISPGCIVSILSVLIYFKELTSNSDYKTILGIRSDLSNYLQKSFKADYKEYTEWEKWRKPGIYPIAPLCVIDSREDESMATLTERYNALIQPTLPAKTVSKAKDLVPDVIKNEIEKLTNSISDKELYTQIMNVIASGFDVLVKNASKLSLSEEYIVKQINSTMTENHIFSIEEICYARSYDVSKLVNRYKTKNVFVAFAEGGITGLAGLPGIPANIAASMFI